MWLLRSSIGRKFVMAVTGVCLVLFVTFHVAMNSVCLLWPAAYNQICEFLGANWYALVASIGLAALFVIHILYAVWLTVQNRRARGADRYAVTSRPPQVEWSSKNMLVLGIVIVAFLIVHLIQFWAKMQLQELVSHDLTALPTVDGAPAAPHFGTLMLQAAFSHWFTLVIYLIGFGALWFHLTHGMWSMFHSVGWDANRWLPRLKCIANWWTSIVVVLFAAQAILFTVQANNRFFLDDPALQQQYGEYWDQCAQDQLEAFQADIASTMEGAENPRMAEEQFVADRGEAYIANLTMIAEAAQKQAPAFHSQALQQADGLSRQLRQYLDRLNAQKAYAEPAPAEAQNPDNQ